MLAINALLFVELAAGLLAHSTALLGDSLDMLGDSLVYGFSLYVLARSERVRTYAVVLKGVIMAVFGLFTGVLTWTGRRKGGDPLGRRNRDDAVRSRATKQAATLWPTPAVSPGWTARVRINGRRFAEGRRFGSASLAQTVLGSRRGKRRGPWHRARRRGGRGAPCSPQPAQRRSESRRANGKQDPRKLAGQSHYGDLVAAPLRDSTCPADHRIVVMAPAAEGGWRPMNTARIAGEPALVVPPSALALPGAVLARHQAEIGSYQLLNLETFRNGASVRYRPVTSTSASYPGYPRVRVSPYCGCVPSGDDCGSSPRRHARHSRAHARQRTARAGSDGPHEDAPRACYVALADAQHVVSTPSPPRICSRACSTKCAPWTDHLPGRHDPHGRRRLAHPRRRSRHLRRRDRAGRPREYTPDGADYEIVDCAGCVVMPGLVQAHVHMCQSLARRRAYDDVTPRCGWSPGAMTARETAGRHLARRIPTASPDARVANVRAALGGQRWDAVELVCLVSADAKLVGVVPLGRLLEAQDDVRIDSLALADTPHVGLRADQERVASLAILDGISAVPVLDDAHRLVGLVSAQALLEVLRHEHVEDLHRLAGIAPAWCRRAPPSRRPACATACRGCSSASPAARSPRR